MRGLGCSGASASPQARFFSGERKLRDPCINSQETGRLNVFYRGADNALYHRYYNEDGWSAVWENLGGSMASGPDSVSWN